MSLFQKGLDRLRYDLEFAHLLDFKLVHERAGASKEYRLNKTILGFQSKLFRDYFKRLPDATLFRITEDRAPREILDQVLDMFYSGEAKFTTSTCYPSFKMCRQIQADNAAQLVVAWMKANLRAEADLTQVIIAAKQDKEDMVVSALLPLLPPSVAASLDSQSHVASNLSRPIFSREAPTTSQASDPRSRSASPVPVPTQQVRPPTPSASEEDPASQSV